MTPRPRQTAPEGQAAPPIVVLCGVAGSGKTTVGQHAAARLGVPFADADAFHDTTARASMAAGRPLTDADRAPWLDRLAAHLSAWHEARSGGVLACSALRAAYRTRLSAGAPTVRFVLLTASPDVLRRRLALRAGHFFPVALLESQLSTLELASGILCIDTDALGIDGAAERVTALART